MDFNSLPDPVIRLIFDQFPLSELIPIGQVCHRWSSLLRSVTAKRRSMTLLIGDSPLNLIIDSKFNIPHLECVQDFEHLYHDSSSQIARSKWTHMEYDWLSASSVHELIHLLPNLNDLTIAINEVSILTYKGPKTNGKFISIIDQLIHLLTACQPKLMHLKVFLYFSGQNQNRIEYELRRLIDPLNSLTSLRTLTMVIQNKFFYNDKLVPLDMPLLGQLEEFYFDSMDPLEIVTASLRRYAEHNQNLRSIGLGNLYAHDTALEFFQNASPDLLEKITQFPDAQFANPFHFQGFCRKFFGITSVAVCLYDSPSLWEIFHFLGIGLRQLIHVRLLVYLPDQFQIQERFVPIQSVRILTMNAMIRSHAQLIPLELEKLFPEVQVLHYIDHSRECVDCFPNDEVLDNWGEIAKRQRECLRLKLQPWKKSRKLKTIFVEGIFGHNGTLQMSVEDL